MDYVSRTIDNEIAEAVREFPAIFVTGPRQSGKTTTLKHCLGDRFNYISLDAPDIYTLAINDPRAFLDSNQAPVIFDEIQNAPDLLPYIKERIDSSRHETGQFVLTGSQNLLSSARIGETLAGRAAVLQLYPLTRRELEANPQMALPWQPNNEAVEFKLPDHLRYWESWLRGGYPEIALDPSRDVTRWYASYVQTYLERDLRTLRQIGDLTQFRSFLRVLANRSTSLLSLSGISRDLGIAVNTVKSWISVLEASHLICVVRPYFSNVEKRMVKSPKVYFLDVGLLCHLTGLRDPEHARSGPLAGAIFETVVLGEIVKTYTHRGRQPQVFFWRTSHGQEVDFVVQDGTRLIPIEVKTSSTPRSAMAKSIQVFQKDFVGQADHGYVVHPGDIRLPLAREVTALPFHQL